jgi:hypothetical protein
MGVQFSDKRQDTGLTGEIGKQPHRTTCAQGLHAGSLAAVAENHRVAFIQQALGAMQADTLAGAGDQDRGVRCSHGRLESLAD